VTNIAFLAARARADCNDFDGTGAAGGECIALALDEPGDARADRAEADDTYFQRRNHTNLSCSSAI